VHLLVLQVLSELWQPFEFVWW